MNGGNPGEVDDEVCTKRDADGWGLDGLERMLERVANGMVAGRRVAGGDGG